MKWVKSTGDDSLPSKGKHEQQLSPDHHPANVHKMNIKNNDVKGIKLLGNDPLPVRIDMSNRTLIQQLFAINKK